MMLSMSVPRSKEQGLGSLVGYSKPLALRATWKKAKIQTVGVLKQILDPRMIVTGKVTSTLYK